jgi:uncharacterized protein YqjF (DUF2071 family)
VSAGTPGRFLTARWLDLLMLNYEVDPALLEPLVPRGTTLDRWDGAAIASLVGFRFVDTRVLGLPIPWHRDFDEVNLRFYVRRVEGREVRRGVVFVRELVPRAAIAWVARTLYNEPYRALPMRHRIHASATGREVGYEWRERGDWVGIAAETSGPASPLIAGSEAEFITEHYWGYTRQRDGGTVEYRVEHPSWQVWAATAPRVHGSLKRTYGAAFADALSGRPRSAFVAVGSEVTVYGGRRLEG